MDHNPAKVTNIITNECVDVLSCCTASWKLSASELANVGYLRSEQISKCH